MTPRVKVVFALASLIVLSLATVAVHRHRVREAAAISVLFNGVRPIPKAAPRIPAQLLSLLIDADFKVVSNLRYVPSTVKDSFCNIEDCNHVGVKFDMVNPGDAMSTDYLIEGVPNKRLVFAALNKESAIVVYERGGYANVLCVTILDFRGGSAWAATLNSHDVRNMHDLRAALAQGKYYVSRDGG